MSMRLVKALLFPPLWLCFLLLPVATVFLVYAMAVLGSHTLPAYAAYALATYTLTVCCTAIPRLVRVLRAVRVGNRYAVRLSGDVRWRVRLSLYGAFGWNGAYALFQLGLGLYHASFWYLSLALYYLLLAGMRFFLGRYLGRHAPGACLRRELLCCRACGWILLVMHSAVAWMTFYLVWEGRSFLHHEITTIAIAAYTFATFSFAVVNAVKHRAWGSPVFSAAKAITLAAACVSMITLTATMLATFGSVEEEAFRRGMLALAGGAVSVFLVVMAIGMIVRSGKGLKTIREEVS